MSTATAVSPTAAPVECAPECCRADCRELATARRVYRSQSDRQWKRDACAVHHALSAAESETLEAMGMVLETVTTLPTPVGRAVAGC